MEDHSRSAAPEQSDNSVIEVNPNVDKQSSIRVKLGQRRQLQLSDEHKQSLMALDFIKTSGEETNMSPLVAQFVEIEPDDYEARHKFILSHPEILRDSELKGLINEAFNAVFLRNDESLARRYVHQAVILQWCQIIGPNEMRRYLKSISSPEHSSRELVKSEVDEKYQHILDMAKEAAKQHERR